MSSNVVKLLGLVISATIIYICVDLKKDEIAEKLGLEKNKISKEKHISNEVKKQQKVHSHVVENNNIQTPDKIEKSDPAFGIILGDNITIVAMFSPSMKEGRLVKYIDTLCKNSSCDNDIRYSEDIKNIHWQDDMIKLIQFLHESKDKKGSIFVNSNTLKVEVDFDDIKDKNKLNKIKKDLISDGLVSLTHSMQVNTPKNIDNSKKVSVTIQKEIKNENISIVKNQKDTLLNRKDILFTKRSDDIEKESKNILDKVVSSLKKKDAKNIEIIVYAKVSDDKMFNKIISQKRADVIKKYLQKKGINVVKSIGMGDSKDTQIDIKINQ